MHLYQKQKARGKKTHKLPETLAPCRPESQNTKVHVDKINILLIIHMFYTYIYTNIAIYIYILHIHIYLQNYVCV